MFLGFRTTICNLIIVNAVFTPCLAASEEIKNDTSVAEALCILDFLDERYVFLLCLCSIFLMNNIS